MNHGRIARQGVIVLIAAGLGSAASLGSTLGFPVIVGTETFGLWIIFFATARAGAVLEPSLLNVGTVFASRALGDSPFDFRGFLRLRFWVAAASGAFSVVLGVGVLRFTSWTDTDSSLRVVFILAAAVVAICRPLIASVVGMHQGLTRYSVGAQMSIAMSVGTAVSVLAAAVVTRELRYMILAAAGTHVAVTVLSELRLRRLRLTLQNTPVRSAPSELRRLLWLNCAATAPSIAFGQADRLVAATVLGPSAVAVYAIVTSIANQMNTPTAALSKPLLQALSGPDVSKQGRRGLLVDSLRLVALTSSASGLICLVGLTVLRRLSSEYAGVTVSLTFVALMLYGLFSLAAVGWWAALARGENAGWLPAGFSFLGALLTLLGVFFLGGWFGIGGAIAANAGFGVMYIFQLIALNSDLSVAQVVRAQLWPTVGFVVGGLGLVLNVGLAGSILLSVIVLAQVVALLRMVLPRRNPTTLGQREAAR